MQKQHEMKTQAAELQEKPLTPLKYTKLIAAAEDGSRSTKDMIDAVFEQDCHLRYQPDGVVVHRDDPALVGKPAEISAKRRRTTGRMLIGMFWRNTTRPRSVSGRRK